MPHPVRQRDHAVDTVDVLAVVLGAPGHLARHRRGAVHGGQDTDEVAGRHPPVRSPDPLEGAPQALGQRPVRPRDPLPARAGRGVVGHGQVVHVHVLAGGDAGRGPPDHLPVLVHERSGGQVPQRDLVPGRGAVGCLGGDADVVAVVQHDQRHDGTTAGSVPAADAARISSSDAR
jgi:hypothetical protein